MSDKLEGISILPKVKAKYKLTMTTTAGIETVVYGNLIPYHTKAIKTLDKKIYFVAPSDTLEEI